MKKKNNQAKQGRGILSIIAYIFLGCIFGIILSKYIFGLSFSSMFNTQPKEALFNEEKVVSIKSENKTSTTIPNKCSKEYLPVCGEDGKTYDNGCLANLANQSYTPGKCQSPETRSGITENKKNKICTREYAPVCGEDGKTYPNACVAEAENIKIISQGECKKEETNNKDFLCTTEYEPVCGEDGKIYSNKCVANKNNVKIVPCKIDEHNTNQSGSIKEFDPSKYHIYENKGLNYGFAMPNYSYYQGFGAQDGAIHTMAIGLNEAGVSSLESAEVKILLYKNSKPTETNNSISVKLDDNYTVYITPNKSDNPKLQKIITTLSESVHKN